MPKQDVKLHIYFYSWHMAGDPYIITPFELAEACKVGEVTVSVEVPNFNEVCARSIELKKLEDQLQELTNKYQVSFDKLRRRMALIQAQGAKKNDL